MWRLTAIVRIVRMFPRWARSVWHEAHRRAMFHRNERLDHYLDDS